MEYNSDAVEVIRYNLDVRRDFNYSLITVEEANILFQQIDILKAHLQELEHQIAQLEQENTKLHQNR